MGDDGRDGLMASLAEAKAQRAALLAEVAALADNIQGVREALGNPLFYSPRPDGDPQSASRFTGYASHDPALRLLGRLAATARAITTAERRLRDAGLEPA